MRKLLLVSGLQLFLINLVFSQNSIRLEIRDSATAEILPSATVRIPAISRTVISNKDGRVIINNITGNQFSIEVSHTGYESKTVDYRITDTSFFIIQLAAQEKQLEDVIISSSRTNSRLENLPTKVEVIGEEEMLEENGIKPGNIASILGDIAGIQLQQTSAATGNADLRVQGLPGKYTQILRDGLPLFGGYSGSFSILQIPPLDLKQVEIVKGASSTLYGGGAIAGMINLISKTPKTGEKERTITLNQSTLKESNANIFLSSRNKKTGYTFFGGLNYQRAVDVNKDGFSDVPDVKSFFIHPRLFFYPDEKNKINIGFNSNYEDRNGGDMQVLHASKDAGHQFFIRNKTFRNTIDAGWENKISANQQFVLKGTASYFNREVSTNVFGMKAGQFSYYTEADYILKSKQHDLVAGINVNGEVFRKKNPDSTLIGNYNYTTIGLFVQDDWRVAPQFTIQPGLRFDHHNQYGNFVLPRLSFLYKISPAFTARLGGGLGYKTPYAFSSEIDEREYPLIQPLDHVKAETSYGGNFDINFRKHIGDWSLTVNQSFYITEIKDPIVLTNNIVGLSYFNAAKSLRTTGTETYIQAQYNDLEIYLGYVYTVAKKLYDPLQPYISLSARNKFATVIAYEFSKKFRAGIEAASTGKQYLDNGNKTPAYLFAAAMMRYDMKHISFVLNCENLLDYRQSKKETIVFPPNNNPIFPQLWAPIDGRVINLSMKFSW